MTKSTVIFNLPYCLKMTMAYMVLCIFKQTVFLCLFKTAYYVYGMFLLCVCSENVKNSYMYSYSVFSKGMPYIFKIHGNFDTYTLSVQTYYRE